MIGSARDRHFAYSTLHSVGAHCAHTHCYLFDGAAESIACGFLAQFMTFDQAQKKIKSNLLLVFSKSSNTTCSVRIARVHISMYERLGMHPLMLPIYQHFFLLSSHATCYCPVATINFHLTFEREKKCNKNPIYEFGFGKYFNFERHLLGKSEQIY